MLEIKVERLDTSCDSAGLYPLQTDNLNLITIAPPVKKFALILLLLVALPDLVSVRAEQIETNWQPYVTFKPDPFIPMVALRKGWGGKIMCHVTINSKTGLVDEVKVIRHTGYPALDAEMVMTLFKWRFKSGTINQANISYRLGVAGRARDLH